MTLRRADLRLEQFGTFFQVATDVRHRSFPPCYVPSNELVAQIHDRMPLILPKAAYERWLGEERDPHDLLVPFPADTMAMWPVSTRVNSPENDDAALLDPAAEELSLKSVAERYRNP